MHFGQDMSNRNSSAQRPDKDANRQSNTERQGQGQSGYGAGRHGEDPSQHYQNRNEPHEPGSDEQPADQPGMGLDDRFTGRRR
jgi:hypothetical protein